MCFSVNAKSNADSISSNGVVIPFSVLKTTQDGVEVRCGGYGSDACAHPTNKNQFYLITDRGPNIDYLGSDGKGKLFPTPDFTPRIGLFEIQENGSIRQIKTILLKTPEGKLITGLPNPKGKGATGEIAYGLDGKIYGTDDYGLDSEGIAAAKDGTFWISDEYGPHIVHYSADGVELERISPHGMTTSGRKMPAVFAKRRANRGMEGLTITPDQKTLIGIMQSTLNNPSKKEIINKNIVRILSFDINSGKTKQYLYLQNPDTDSCSGISAISKKEFIVIERDGKFLGKGSAKKCLYRIDISKATDVSGNFESPNGLLVNGKTLEQCTTEELKAAGIKFAEKKLITDLAADYGYKHDKLEGVWMIDKNTMAVANDNDFALIEKDNKLCQKILPGSNNIEDDVVYIIKIK